MVNHRVDASHGEFPGEDRGIRGNSPDPSGTESHSERARQLHWRKIYADHPMLTVGVPTVSYECSRWNQWPRGSRYRCVCRLDKTSPVNGARRSTTRSTMVLPATTAKAFSRPKRWMRSGKNCGRVHGSTASLTS